MPARPRHVLAAPVAQVSGRNASFASLVLPRRRSLIWTAFASVAAAD